MKPSLIRSFVGVCLLWVLVWTGCRQREAVSPEPAQQAALIQKVKHWFELQKQRARAKSTTDTLLASREPDWDRSTYYIIANTSPAGIFLEMPLKYGGKHQVNRQDYTNGKKGLGYTKLVLKYVSENQFQPVVMRFFADSAYLAQPHPPLS